MTKTSMLGLGAVTALVAATFSTGAFAHTGVSPTFGFASGFMHPLAGLDHVLAMVGVGLFAWMLKGRAAWLVPAAFLGMMAVGGILGAYNMAVPMVEVGIALSIFVIGALVASGRSVPLAAAMAIVGSFAVFHGHAHGTEMAATVSGFGYGVGFMAATAVLHGVGLGIAAGTARLSGSHGAKFARAGGAAMAVAGLAFVAGAF